MSVWGGTVLLCTLAYLRAHMAPYKAMREVQPTPGVQNPHVGLTVYTCAL
jgi:hypothetical protein